MTADSNPFSLEGRWALITGASGHLGREMAKACAVAGANVIVHGRDRARLEGLCAELATFGREAQPLVGDLLEDGFAERAARYVAQLTDSLELLVNNAHPIRSSKVGEDEREHFMQGYKAGVVSVFSLVMALEPFLKRAVTKFAGGGSVINVASMYGWVSPDHRVYPEGVGKNPASYGAAKAALLQLTRHLACELGPGGIRVNSISPGPFPSDRTKQSAPELVRALEGRVPLGRCGLASEIGGVVVFLGSRASSFVTGADLAVDGGWRAW